MRSTGQVQMRMTMNEKSSLLRQSSLCSDEDEQSLATPRAIFNLWSVAWVCLGVAMGMIFMHHQSFGAVQTLPSHDVFRNSASKYSHFQTLGFQIYTGGAPAFLESFDEATKSNITVKNPECTGRKSYGVLGGWEHMCYIGLSNPIEDVKKRLEIMKDAVEKAYEKASKDSSTLKVFVAPEFYFRGLDGAYSFQDDYGRENCGAVCVMLQGLEGIAADKRFEDWLFVFGTAIASDVLPTEDEFDFLFYNFAPVYRGYDPANTDHRGKRFLVPKRYVSKIDFLTPRRHFSELLAKELVDEPKPSPEHDQTVLNPIDFHQYRYDHHMWSNYKQELNDLGYAMIEYGWMIVEDITFTLEICFDHKQRTALTTYLADIVTGSRTLIPSSSNSRKLEYVPIPEHQAQISLVSSAGMQVKPASLALMSEGTIFLQDGLTDDNSVMIGASEAETFGCQTVECLEFDGGSESVQRRARFTDTDIFFEHELITSFEKHSIYGPPGEWVEKLDGLFSTKFYEVMISVYEPAPVVFAGSKPVT